MFSVVVLHDNIIVKSKFTSMPEDGFSLEQVSEVR